MQEAIIYGRNYSEALKQLKLLLVRKGNETHNNLYYAVKVAKSFVGVDAKKLEGMLHESSNNSTILGFKEFNKTK